MKYHRNCRSTHQSPHHVKLIVDKRTNVEGRGTSFQTSSSNRKSTDGGILTRSSPPSGFEWTTKCFICSEVCSSKHRSTWSQVQSMDKDSTGKSLYNSVLEEALIRDDVMMTRLLGIGNSDTIAAKARYTKKGCLSSYINTRSLSSLKRSNRFLLHLLVSTNPKLLMNDKYCYFPL